MVPVNRQVFQAGDLPPSLLQIGNDIYIYFKYNMIWLILWLLLILVGAAYAMWMLSNEMLRSKMQLLQKWA